jgi:hypothetical protein
LQEYKLELNQLFDSEKGENKKKRMSLKANIKESKEEMKSLVHILKKSMRYKYKEKEIPSSNTKRRKTYIAGDDNDIASSMNQKMKGKSIFYRRRRRRRRRSKFI